ncbi:YopX family protein [Desulfosporosinus sp. SB140]|uniref:YopX family protein n=1 Tax=Desulfosporosinus paludis TaxID=3115649 RepID=UPI00388E8B67
MNREILFRGKRVDNGELVYGYYIRYEHMGIVKHIIVVNWAQVYANSHKVIPATVGQFTGLRDKNGKEIYEGDILISDTYPDNILKVEYRDSSFGAYPILKGNSGVVNLHVLALNTYEVIGNVHENPEILGVKA